MNGWCESRMHHSIVVFRQPKKFGQKWLALTEVGYVFFDEVLMNR